MLTAKDGEEAISIFEKNKSKIDMVILDMVMPKRSGKDVFDHIKKTTPQMHILFSSGYSTDGLHLNYVLDEGMELLPKPYRSQDLLQKTRYMIDR